MFAIFVEVDNSGEEREARIRGLREELAPAMKQTPGFQSAIFATNDPAGAGFMVVVYDSRENADAVAKVIEIGGHPRPGVTVKRVEVFEVVATA